jgi:hypothetical protein
MPPLALAGPGGNYLGESIARNDQTHHHATVHCGWGVRCQAASFKKVRRSMIVPSQFNLRPRAPNGARAKRRARQTARADRTLQPSAAIFSFPYLRGGQRGSQFHGYRLAANNPLPQPRPQAGEGRGYYLGLNPGGEGLVQ